MQEASLRSWHRFLGIILALFIFVQAITGALISLQFALNFAEPLEVLEGPHTGGGLAGNIYRMLLGLGLLFMAVTGAMIYFKIRARTKRKTV